MSLASSALVIVFCGRNNVILLWIVNWFMYAQERISSKEEDSDTVGVLGRVVFVWIGGVGVIAHETMVSGDDVVGFSNKDR
jgi:hypothetical protein